jgi:hypothetical protein
MTEVKEATGADWCWLMAHMSEHDKAPSPDVVVERMTALSIDEAMKLPAGEFRDLFEACTHAIVGNDSESD